VERIAGVARLRERVGQEKGRGAVVGVVPTMGAYHRGHLSLMRRARRECGLVVVTLFVNPTQFGAGEDFERYPRDLEADAGMAEREGVDILFHPAAEAVYPPGFSTWVAVEQGVEQGLEGASRPGHFRGVATVVAKLFQMVQPDRAYFGEKDYQQLQVIRRMAADLDMPVQVVPCPIIREPDGLAMSSRNRYLNPAEREAARSLFRCLQEAQRLVSAGERAAAAVIRAARAVLEAEPLVRPDYLEIVDPETLVPVELLDRPAQIAVAARIGSTRLIDNTRLLPD